jgi:hypothetical protein
MTSATATNGESPAIRNLIRDWRNELALFDWIRSWRMSSLSHRLETESRGYKEDLLGECLIPAFLAFHSWNAALDAGDTVSGNGRRNAFQYRARASLLP